MVTVRPIAMRDFSLKQLTLEGAAEPDASLDLQLGLSVHAWIAT